MVTTVCYFPFVGIKKFYSMLFYCLICYSMQCYCIICYCIVCYSMQCYYISWYAILHYALLCYAVPCYAILCNAIVFYAILFNPMLFYAMLFYCMICYSMLCFSVICYAILLYAMLFHAMRFYGILLYTMLFYAMPFHAMLFYAMLFYAMLIYSINAKLKKQIEMVFNRTAVSGTDPLDLLSVWQPQVITHTPVLMREAACKESHHNKYFGKTTTEKQHRCVRIHSKMVLPHGPRSEELCSAQRACRAAALSGGFKLNFFISFLPYRERNENGKTEKTENIKKLNAVEEKICNIDLKNNTSNYSFSVHWCGLTETTLWSWEVFMTYRKKVLNSAKKKENSEKVSFNVCCSAL